MKLDQAHPAAMTCSVAEINMSQCMTYGPHEGGICALKSVCASMQDLDMVAKHHNLAFIGAESHEGADANTAASDSSKGNILTLISTQCLLIARSILRDRQNDLREGKSDISINKVRVRPIVQVTASEALPCWRKKSEKAAG